MNRRTFLKTTTAFIAAVLGMAGCGTLDSKPIQARRIGKWSGPANWFRYLVIDRKTGKMIEYCFEADESTGEYWVYRLKKGRPYTEDGIEAAWEKKQGDIQILTPKQASEYNKRKILGYWVERRDQRGGGGVKS